EVVPDAQLFERAMARAHQFAQRAPLAVREVKSLMARPRPATAEVDALERLFDSADATEGINAFIDKRGATFRGE
ncbi:MAG: enoyl-CoA hydratase-related protein, partial [Rhodoglobus sp.]|nr:enoyl-CoA hydratase-related protein [Rhodoglobus sp.]